MPGGVPGDGAVRGWAEASWDGWAMLVLQTTAGGTRLRFGGWCCCGAGGRVGRRMRCRKSTHMMQVRVRMPVRGTHEGRKTAGLLLCGNLAGAQSTESECGGGQWAIV